MFLKGIKEFGLFSWFGIGSQNNSSDKTPKKLSGETKYLSISLLQVII